MINSGRNLLHGGEYFPSRMPGYLIPEIIIGGLSLAGGFYLTNACSALLATLSMMYFWRLLSEYYGESDTRFLTLMVAFNPVFVIAATSTIDYIYSIFFIIAGVFYYLKRWPYWAGILFALGIGSRLSNSIIVAILCLYFLHDVYMNQDRIAFRRTIFSMCLAVFLTVLFYVPSYIAANNSLAFLTYFMADFNWIDHLSRFVYKNIYLFGVLPVMVIVYGIFQACIHCSFRVPRQIMVITGLLMVFIQELLFFKIPLEMSYLLPLLFIIFPLWVLLADPGRAVKVMLLLTTLIYGFVFNIELLDIKYNAEGTVAVSASVSPSIQPGAIIKDINKREASAKKYTEMFNVQ